MRYPVSGDGGPAPSPSTDGIDKSKLEDIPEPPQQYFGILGHIPDIDPSFPIRSFWNMMALYGPIFKVNLGAPRVVVGSQEYVNEVCDQERFKKVSRSEKYLALNPHSSS